VNAAFTSRITGVSLSQVEVRLKMLAGPIMRATIPPNIEARQQGVYLKRTFSVERAATGLLSIRSEIPQSAKCADGDCGDGAADCMCECGQSAIGAWSGEAA
jgi:hypothetical protein